jgi:hypothetical protein
MKIGFNETNERILHVQNIVSFLGGDKSGRVYHQFVKGLAFQMADKGMLRNQQLI